MGQAHAVFFLCLISLHFTGISAHLLTIFFFCKKGREKGRWHKWALSESEHEGVRVTDLKIKT